MEYFVCSYSAHVQTTVVQDTTPVGINTTSKKEDLSLIKK